MRQQLSIAHAQCPQVASARQYSTQIEKTCDSIMIMRNAQQLSSTELDQWQTAIELDDHNSRSIELHKLALPNTIGF